VSDLPPPPQPYRSAVIVHGILAALIVVVAWLSAGDIVKALAVAIGYFVLATGWSWFRFRQGASQATAAQRGGESEGGEGN
jgi:hypothetical protein